ncbi:43kDa postsynaptic protein [Parasponia andersonii]|uniref:43kDa postsynaptic protein n=1 Tax=Parasponia andersonii TaxID=3476 RepID=A0A2P5CQ99_PARAD|nr:43kDa postsynaptic protein [Parasponia andersonii]
MFFVRVHSVDADHPLTFENLEFSMVTATATAAKKAQSNPDSGFGSRFSERRGITHLFRSISHSSLPNPSSRSTVLFVIAVPNYFSFEDFIRFCGSRIDHVTELVFIRNDGMEDRYSVLIRLMNQLTADGFYCSFNGKKFSPGEAEVCHFLFLLSVDYTESAEIAGTPPHGCTELPTCPVCLERLDADTSGILSTLCDHSFQCPCTSKWTYLSCQICMEIPRFEIESWLFLKSEVGVCRFCQQQDDKPTCSVCGTLENLWVCVICGFVGCGRYKEGHAIRHWKDTQHCYSLDLTTQQIWDYVGDSYVHRLNQSKADGKLGEMNSRCLSFEGDCGSCTCSEDSSFGGALYSSKVDAIVDEYNHLLASQLENQRQYYESLLTEAKSKLENAISEAVERAVTLKMQEIQNKLEKYIEEKNVVADINRNLIKDQEIWRKKFKEIEERVTVSLKLRDEKILDLEEQIRDLSVYIEAQKTLSDMTDSDGIKGGTLLPVPSKQSSPSNTRKQTKSGRRRN